MHDIAVVPFLGEKINLLKSGRNVCHCIKGSFFTGWSGIGMNEISPLGTDGIDYTWIYVMFVL